MTAVPDLMLGDLHGSLTDPVLRSMDFLNEIAERHPTAISLAAGRPSEDFFDTELLHDDLRTYFRYLTEERQLSTQAAARVVMQYGPARGVITEVLTRHLELDEGIVADPAAVVVTVGCQEAMFLTLRALRRDERDVVLAVAPTYVGLTGATRLLDMPVLPVATDSTGIDLGDLARTVRRARRSGLRPRICYVMPDFANPSARCMDLATRKELLRVSAEEDLLLLEDNPYGLFYGTPSRLPTLKALDEHRRVVYLGSFAKTVVPGARVGYVVADQRIGTPQGIQDTFAGQIARLKSMLTVNTAPIGQAIVAGRLIRHGYSLVQATARERAGYLRKLGLLLDGLDRFFGDVPGVSWNTPQGGFFTVVTVPFVADDDRLEQCAERFGVLWTPMSHFYANGGGAHQLRLCHSSVAEDQIEPALDRLWKFVSTTLPSTTT